MPGVIMMGSMFSLFVIEMWLNSKMGGHSHSHGGPMGLDASGSAAANTGPPHRPPRNSRTSYEADDVVFEKKMAQKM